MTTTFAAIRDRLVTVIEAATPGVPAQELFRYKPSNKWMLEEWVESNSGSVCFRKFDIRKIGDSADNPGKLHPDEVDREEQARITVAYPRLPDLYGSGYESMEDCVRADARQIRDICMSGSTWVSVNGWSGVTSSVIAEPQRGPVVWLQVITLTLLYCEAQTLT